MVYQVIEQDLETHNTLSRRDLGKWFVLINGCLQFVENKEAGQKLLTYIKK